MTDSTAVILSQEHLVDDGSLRSRLAARRNELREQRPFDLDVPGYRGVLRARYRVLDFPMIRNLGLRQENNTNRADAELKIAADTLVNACQCLLEVLPDGDVRETAFKWSAETARDLFGIGTDEVPDGATARVALFRIIPNSTALMLHYAEYDRRARGVDDDVAQDVEGELEAV